MITTSIKEFYQTNNVLEDFDEIFYQKEYPETKDFYQPYCKNNNIDDRHRLYFHYYHYGKNLSINKNHLKFSFPIIQTSKNYKSSSKLCIIVHAYYFDIWEDELSKCIQEIKHPYDLYITVPDDESIKQKIKLKFPDAMVLPVVNRGSDVWPFLYVMKTIKSLGYNYDYILKLHTKKSLDSNPKYTKFFRNSVYENLCNNCDYILSKLD
jgi:lipopolysaccharide biosynthesis protein